MSDDPNAPMAAPPLDPEVATPDKPEEKLLVARYGLTGNTGLFRYDLESPPVIGTRLVVRTERGVELAKTLINVGNCPGRCCVTRGALDRYLRQSGPDYPFHHDGRVLRLATAQDFNDQAHLDKAGEEEFTYAQEQLRQLNIDMRLVAVEHLLGGERILFYFTSETRVDFRELVRRMAWQYHTRIEMRQVGARDEARIVADYERCGQRCCCQEFVKALKPVSMRMAKMQKATLDPTKISGRCGRLMCCLRYEDATYDQLAKALPRKNTWVKTADGTVGKVIDCQVLTQLVRLLLPDMSQTVVPNDQITERGVPEPPRPAPPVRVRPKPPQRPRPERRPVDPSLMTAEEQLDEAMLADGALGVVPEAKPESLEPLIRTDVPDDDADAAINVGGVGDLGGLTPQAGASDEGASPDADAPGEPAGEDDAEGDEDGPETNAEAAPVSSPRQTGSGGGPRGDYRNQPRDQNRRPGQANHGQGQRRPQGQGGQSRPGPQAGQPGPAGQAGQPGQPGQPGQGRRRRRRRRGRGRGPGGGPGGGQGPSAQGGGQNGSPPAPSGGQSGGPPPA